MTDFGNYKGYQGASRLLDGKSRATHIDDERLKIITESIVDLRGKDVLDVGCNTGYVTVQAALSYHAKSVTGIEIDEELLDRARSHLSFRRSRIYCALPTDSTGTAISTATSAHDSSAAAGGDAEGHAKDRREIQRPPPEAPRDRLNYFPISSIQKYGHLPAAVCEEEGGSGGGGGGGGGGGVNDPTRLLQSGQASGSRGAKPGVKRQPSSALKTSSSAGASASLSAATTTAVAAESAGKTVDPVDVDDPDADIFPGNVEFRLEDWAAPGSEVFVKQEYSGCGGEGAYDVILALSVVKWLHLEHGDRGLKTFFRNCHTALRAPHGLLVLEIQDWKSYLNAVRKQKAPHLKGMLEEIRIRPVVEEGEAGDGGEVVGFESVIVGEVGFLEVGKWKREGMREVWVFRKG